jgi:Spy/CpxP family protein refolding chaperone
MRTTIGIAVALALAAVPAAAQHQGHGQGMGQGMGQGQGMQGDMAAMHLRGFQPDQLLAKRAELSLTPDQVTRLESLSTEAKTKTDQAQAQHDQSRQELMQALMADTPNLEAVGSHFQAAHGAMGAVHWAELQAGIAAMGVLTDQQRATVKSWGHQGMGQGQGRKN